MILNLSLMICLRMNNLFYLDQISIEELDIIYKIPHCVPISAHHKWNFDDLLERMWEYLQLVRMYVQVYRYHGVFLM